MLSSLLLVNACVEGGAGVLALLAPSKIIGSANGKESLLLVQAFGIGLLSIGVTSFLASRSSDSSQMDVGKGALLYHALIVCLALRGPIKRILPIIGVHSILALAFTKVIIDQK